MGSLLNNMKYFDEAASWVCLFSYCTREYPAYSHVLATYTHTSTVILICFID
jgi:hypothetical protein